MPHHTTAPAATRHDTRLAPPAAPPRPDDPPLATARALLRLLLGPPADRSFAVRLWDGSAERPGSGPPAFTFVVHSPAALRRALLPPSELALVEAYLDGELDVEGSMESAATLTDRIAAALRSPRRAARALRLLLALPGSPRPAHEDRPTPRAAGGGGHARPRHSPDRDARSVRFHYDVGNEFFALWLDPRMQYSCAYFPTGEESIAAAQEAKLAHICSKLRLAPGQRLLDVGCGWGGLLEYAATRHGVSGLGITLSERQAAAARARLAAAGVADRCRIEVHDYRQLPPDSCFDRIVSIGMREHVGAARLDEYFTALHRVLAPGGVFLDHAIVRAGDAVPAGARARIARRLWRRDAFIDRYVFPDGEVLPLAPVTEAAERAGFETRDVESLREHYTLTLRRWVERLEASRAAAAALVGERTYRVWRLYMAASAHGFRTGRLSVCQSLYVRRRADGSSGAPLTRGYIE